MSFFDEEKIASEVRGNTLRAYWALMNAKDGARGKRSFLKPEAMHGFTKALDNHIDNKRIPYNYRDNSKTTRIRTAIKEDPKKLAQYLRGIEGARIRI